jgi:hypothetical protein
LRERRNRRAVEPARTNGDQFAGAIGPDIEKLAKVIKQAVIRRGLVAVVCRLMRGRYGVFWAHRGNARRDQLQFILRARTNHFQTVEMVSAGDSA